MNCFSRLRRCWSVFWQVTKVNFQLTYGVWRLFALPQPMVSIFGGSRIKQDDVYSRQARTLSAMLVARGISVLTGGGPGIMEAANCGALPPEGAGGVSMGIGVKELGEPKNMCVQEYLELDYFFARKWLLTHYSSSFAIFPGGFGTMDELTEILTLMQTKKLPRKYIVLIGTEYWAPFMQWVTNEAIFHDLIAHEDTHLFTVTDDLEDAFCLLTGECKLPPYYGKD